MFCKKSIAVFFSCLLITLNISFLSKTIAKAVADTKTPVLKSVSIDKVNVTAGESITVKIDADDDLSGIYGASIYYTSPSGKNYKSYSLYPNNSEKLECTIPIDGNDEKGIWKLNSVSLTDKEGNTEYVNNSGIMNSGTLKDLSTGDFKVEQAIKQFDINDDSSIDIKDLANVAKDYNVKKSDRTWDSEYDYNDDGIIDICDFVVLLKEVK